MYTGKQMNNVTIEVHAKSNETNDLLGVFYICKVGNACVIKSGLCFSPECAIEAGTKFVLPIPKVPVDDLEVLFLNFYLYKFIHPVLKLELVYQVAKEEIWSLYFRN